MISWADGKVKGHTQTCYVLALAFDLLPKEKRPAAVKFLADLSGDDFPLEGNGTRSRRRQAPGEAAGEAVRFALERSNVPCCRSV